MYVVLCLCIVYTYVYFKTYMYLSYYFPFFKLVDYRVEFSKWWCSEFKTIKFPSQGTVFDYLIDNESKKWMSWSEKIPKFEYDSDIPLQVP